MNIDVENQQNAALKSYEAHRKLSDKMIQQRLAVPRSFARPKIRITPLSQRAQFLNQVITSETIIDYMDAVQTILDENANKSYREKLSLVNELTFEWAKVYDKAIRDKQMPKNFLDDMNKRMIQVLQTYLTGTTVPLKSTKQMKEEADKQITQINKLMTDLNRLKEKTTDGVRIMNIDESIRVLTKALLNISQTEIPYPDDEFDGLILRNSQPLARTATAIVDRADAKKAKAEQDDIDAAIREISNAKRKINGKLAEMQQYYEEVGRSMGFTNSEIEELLVLAGEQDIKISGMIGDIKSSSNPMDVIKRAVEAIKIYGDIAIDIDDVLKTELPSAYPAKMPPKQPQGGPQPSKAVQISDREAAIDKLTNILGTNILNIPADKNGQIDFGRSVIPMLSKKVQDMWQKEKVATRVNILRDVKATYLADPEFKSRIPREGIRLAILQELKQLYKGGSAPAQSSAVPTGEPTVHAGKKTRGPKNNIAFQRAIKQIAQGKTKATKKATKKTTTKKGGVASGPIKASITEFMGKPSLPEPGIEKVAHGLKKIKELNEPFPSPQKRNFEIISF